MTALATTSTTTPTNSICKSSSSSKRQRQWGQNNNDKHGHFVFRKPLLPSFLLLLLSLASYYSPPGTDAYCFLQHSTKTGAPFSSYSYSFSLLVSDESKRITQRTRTRTRRKRMPSWSSQSSSALSSTQQKQEIDDDVQLESLTVKELRQMLKDYNFASRERGLLTRLKKKQDLIDYLQQNLIDTPYMHNGNDTSPKTHKDADPTTSLTNIDNNHSNDTMKNDHNGKTTIKIQKNQNKKIRSPLHMPKFSEYDDDDSNQGAELKDTSATGQQQQQQDQQTPNKKRMSPKDIIFEEVYQRYPPLREQQQQQVQFIENDETNHDDDDDNEDEEDRIIDLRQVYHPIFKNDNNKSSDMDIIFIGTASCTPAVTRGVSCTALRLNWRRSNPLSSSINTNDPNQQQTAKRFVNTHIDAAFTGGTWLFDAGECTQLQVQRTTSVKPSKITKIFITHAHGDHTFGLPGLLCLMGQDSERGSSSSNDAAVKRPVIDIYGPEGLRMWLRVAIRYSVSRIVPPYRVHEIMDVPMAPEWTLNQRTGRFFFKGNSGTSNGNNNHQNGPPRNQTPRKWNNVHNNNHRSPPPNRGLAGEDPTSWISSANSMIHLDPSPQYGEVEGGRDIFPMYDHPLSSGGAPVWEIIGDENDGDSNDDSNNDVKVYAAPMSHGIPCVGYVVEEQNRPGRLRSEVVEPVVRRNLNALKEAGFKIPMKAMAVIKNLPVGSAFTFPDGTVMSQEEAVEPPRMGRKVVICGDTADCSAIENLARNADVLIHEATNTFLNGIDSKTGNMKLATRDAILHGHSTPMMAGKFAQRIGAKRLILNHFSARYKGDLSVESLSVMTRIEKQAIEAGKLNETQVAAAWDLMILPVPQR